MVIALLIWAAQAASPPAAPAAVPELASALRVENRNSSEACKSKPAAEIVVCKRQGSPYRIDPTVLQAQRAHAALPPKPPVGAETVADSGCTGGRGAGCTN